jgi:hypothetical protein
MPMDGAEFDDEMLSADRVVSRIECCSAIMKNGIRCSYPSKTLNFLTGAPICLFHNRINIIRANPRRVQNYVGFPLCSAVTKRGTPCKRAGSLVVNGVNYCKSSGHCPIGLVQNVPNICPLVGRGVEHEINVTDDCPICFTNLGTNDMIKTNCDHVFHKECLNKWLEVNDSCPVCRRRSNVSRTTPSRSLTHSVNIDIY